MQLRKIKPPAKAQTLKEMVLGSFSRRNGNAGICSGLGDSSQGELFGALPRKVGGKTLTVDRVPGQSARKVSWLSTGLVDIKEGALAALPLMTSVNANTQWVSFKRAACAQRTRPERLRRGAAFCGSSCLALQCRRVSSV